MGLFDGHNESLGISDMDGIIGLMDVSLRELREMVVDRVDREAWRAAIHGVTESDTTERMN